MAYSRTTWVDEPSTDSPITAAHLNNIEQGIVNAYEKNSGTLVDADIAPTALIGIAKLADYPADATTFLRGDAVWATPTAGGLTRLCDLTLSASQASFDTNTILGTTIPSGFAHLKIVLFARCDTVTTADTVQLRFNNDSSAIYDNQYVRSAGASTSAAESFAATSAIAGLEPGASGSANSFGSSEILIPHYTSTVSNKTCVYTTSEKHAVTTGGFLVQTGSGCWRSNTAITRITALSNAGGNFVAGSRFTLYGMI